MGRRLLKWREVEKFLMSALMGLTWGAAYRRKGFLQAMPWLLMSGCEAEQAQRFLVWRKGKTCVRKRGHIKHTC